MHASSNNTSQAQASGNSGQSDRVAELARLCDRVIEAATEMKQQVLAAGPDASLLPADVERRLSGHLYDNPNTTVAAVVSRCVTFWFRCVSNVEEIAPDLARIILAGRPVEPAPATKAVPR